MKKIAALLVCLTSGLSHSFAQDITSGLVARYTFEGSPNDVSGNGNNATPAGVYQYVSNGLVGSALRITGDGSLFYSGGGHVLLPTFGTYMNTGFTVSLWAKDESLSGNPSNEEMYIAFGIADEPTFAISLNSVTKQVLYYLNGAIGGAVSSVSKTLNFNTDLAVWKHLALTYTPGKMAAYFNGVKIGEQTISVNVFPVTRAALGRHYWSGGAGSSARMSVTLDNVRIYNRALTDTDVQQIYVTDGLPSAPALTGTTLLSDEFDGTLNSTLWQVLAPQSDSRMSASNGNAVFFQNGVLIAKQDFPAAIEVRGRFGFFGGTYDSFHIALRTDGTLVPPYYPFQSGVGVQFNRRGGDDGDQTGQRNIYLTFGAGRPAVITNFTFAQNTYYDFRLVDDGDRLTLYLNNLSTPIASGQVSERGGNKVGMNNRGFVPWWPLYDNQVRLESISITTPSPVIVAPLITSNPAAITVVEGQSATLGTIATGTAPLLYQWRRDGVPISGATDSTFTIAATRIADAGSYSVTVANAAGSIISSAASLIVKPAEPGRLANLSIRTATEAGNGTLIVGFVLGGSGTIGPNSLLLRAAGPSLAQFGVSGPLPDPVLSLFDGGRLISSNDDWGGSAALALAATNVGAFAFAANSKDAAIASSLPASNYTAQAFDGIAATGVALVEVYDTSASFSYTRPRLVNVSARAAAGAGDATMIAGFNIRGTTSVTVLIRGVGPTLTQFGVTGVLANPRLTLFHDSTLVGVNDNWGDVGASTIASTAAAVGAFALSANSLDSVILATLQPGSYTVQLTGVGSAVGVALVEVYEVPK